ncbi:DUF1295 domain protein [Aspergillus mulundensis]|uniref:Steroid 5-alpha reductase C-terminal domain-containing protein n=1 Tax=Aspergillus mulundensis TaxID=1810919 RepID=A0A3D8RY82_9EURO|nr:hypothetical protein DSM5745_05820 [Aspergillus mulundensis]RDW78968.1 hypothetical protein DSM5745_05820 [Aspergillus mulundensis]
MAEQDVYSSRLSTGPLPVDRAASHLPQTSGAEQDLYGSRFSSGFDKARQQIPRVGQAAGTAAEQDLYGSHFSTTTQSSTAAALGLLQSAALPSFTFHAAFSTIAYGISRYTDRAEGKDWFWPTGMTLNAWYSAIGSKVLNDGLSLSAAWSTLNYPEKLLLTGVTAWGVRLLHRIATRSIARGKDDPRYDAAKKDPGFWNKSLFTMFLPEAAAQTLISLPFVLPYRATAESVLSSPLTSQPGWFHALAVFLFSTGFAIEVLADKRLAAHKKNGDVGVCRDGVWSIVRHPNYLGDALIHFSFPILLLGAGLFHPLAALGPVANYVFLRFVGGDRENEATQAERYAKEDPIKARDFAEYRAEKNSFWPSVKELGNKWTWAVVLAGAGGVVLERGIRSVC